MLDNEAKGLFLCLEFEKVEVEDYRKIRKSFLNVNILNLKKECITNYTFLLIEHRAMEIIIPWNVTLE